MTTTMVPEEEEWIRQMRRRRQTNKAASEQHEIDVIRARIVCAYGEAKGFGRYDLTTPDGVERMRRDSAYVFEPESRHNDDGVCTVEKCAARMQSMPAGATFWPLGSSGGGEVEVASGDVFVCELSGAAHICTATTCEFSRVSGNSEARTCALTARDFGPPLAGDDDLLRTISTAVSTRNSSLLMYRSTFTSSFISAPPPLPPR